MKPLEMLQAPITSSSRAKPIWIVTVWWWKNAVVSATDRPGPGGGMTWVSGTKITPKSR